LRYPLIIHVWVSLSCIVLFHSNNLIMSIWLVSLLIVLTVDMLSGGFFNMILVLFVSSLLPLLPSTRGGVGYEKREGGGNKSGSQKLVKRA
jgi:hypothetical protein